MSKFDEAMQKGLTHGQDEVDQERLRKKTEAQEREAHKAILFPIVTRIAQDRFASITWDRYKEEPTVRLDMLRSEKPGREGSDPCIGVRMTSGPDGSRTFEVSSGGRRLGTERRADWGRSASCASEEELEEEIAYATWAICCPDWQTRMVKH